MGLAVGPAVVIEPVLGSFQDRPRDLGGLAEAAFLAPYYKRRNAAVVPSGNDVPERQTAAPGISTCHGEPREPRRLK